MRLGIAWLINMKFGLGPKISNLFVAIYVLATLFLRFYLEPQLKGHFLLSIGLGAFALLFLWALIKGKIIRPTIFDLSNRM